VQIFDVLYVSLAILIFQLKTVKISCNAALKKPSLIRTFMLCMYMRKHMQFQRTLTIGLVVRCRLDKVVIVVNKYRTLYVFQKQQQTF
jgi:hypothetical protein